MRKHAASRLRSRRARAIRTGVAILRRAREKGFASGYGGGKIYGYHFGRCEAIMSRYAPQTVPIRDIHLLYVTSGLGVPYAPIDEAIVETLKKTVARLTVVLPTDDIPEIANREKPDAMLVLNGMNFNKDHAEKVRDSGIKTAVWLTDDPYYTDATVSFVRHYDHVFTLELSCVAYYTEIGCKRVHYLPFANNFNIYRPKPVEPSKRFDVLFIGSGYWNRIALFDSIAPYLSGKKLMIAGWWWDRLQNYHLISDKIKLGMWMTPEQTSEYYSGAKIVINLHRSPDNDGYNKNSKGIPAFSLNPRTFEIAGSAVLQLSDVRTDLQNQYEPGSEIATYESPEELIGKIDYYLANEEERQRIAWEGLKRTLVNHTYEKRLQTLLAHLFS